MRSPRRAARPSSPETITDRLFLPMLLESIRALEDGIASGSSDVDKASVLGLGFPASRGGILTWCDTEGAKSILARLAPYQSLGPSFHAPGRLARMASTNTTFGA